MIVHAKEITLNAIDKKNLIIQELKIIEFARILENFITTWQSKLHQTKIISINQLIFY